jgi:hypothetical protein
VVMPLDTLETLSDAADEPAPRPSGATPPATHRDAGKPG